MIWLDLKINMEEKKKIMKEKYTYIQTQILLNLRNQQKKLTRICFGDIILNLEVHNNFSSILKNHKSTLFAIIEGSISNHKNKNVATCGDILRLDDLKILSKVFKIKKNLKVAKVSISR